jgi:alpha-1,2-mannosyltransferase
MIRPKPATVLFAAAGFTLLAALFAVRIGAGMADFDVNVKAGARLWAGETLYRTADSHWQFKYSPFSALVYLPLSALPLPAAKAVWFVLVVLAIGAIVVLSRALAASGPPARARLVIGLAFLALAKFFMREIQLGQINAIITALLLGAVFLLAREEERRRVSGEGDALPGAHQALAGFLWGLATALKPYAVIFLPYFVLKGKWKTLASGLALIAASLAVPSLFYGIPGNLTVLKEWVTSLSRSTPILLSAQDNVSLLGLLMKWTGGAPAASLAYAAAVAVLAILTLVFLHEGRPDARPAVGRPAVGEAALLLLFIPLISPLGWDYTFLSALPAAVLVMDRWGAFPRTARALLAANFLVTGLALYDLLGRKAYAAFMARSIPTLNFLILAAALFYLRRKKAA